MSAALHRRLDRVAGRRPSGIRAMSDAAVRDRINVLLVKVLADPTTAPEQAELFRAAAAEAETIPPPLPWPPLHPALDRLRESMRNAA